mgnify:FL=1
MNVSAVNCAPWSVLKISGCPCSSARLSASRQKRPSKVFESCQATWDLDSNKIKDGAAASACDHYFDNDLCRLADSNEEAKDLLFGLFLESLLESLDVEEGPCGKLLNSDSTDQDRLEARQYTQDLNRLMAEKARAFSGRNGVRVIYSDTLFRSMERLQPEHVSRFDCFHPSRTGQVFLADQVWHGFNRNRAQAFTTVAEDFARQSYCPDGQPDSPDCWVEINDDDDPTSGKVRIGEERLRISNSDTGIERPLALGGFNRAWLSFNWARRDLENMGDYVTVDVSPDGGATWAEIDRFQGDGNDFGLHQGDYYDISDLASEETVLRFRTAPGFGSNDRLLVDNVGIVAWSDTPEIARLETPAEGSVQSGVGLIRGWACEAENVAISIDGGELIPIAQGTQRGDTSGVCGDDDNGYGMVLAWGLLGSGPHQLRTFVDGADLGAVEFEVATIGDGFVKGLEGEYELADFPASDESVRVTWSEADQNFLITGYDTGGGFGDVGLDFSDTPGNGNFPEAGASVGGARHESPAHRSIQSGVGLIRGWACEAESVAVSIDGGAMIPVAYGTSRGDTEAVCGDADNGYGMVFAWGLLGNGVHRMQTFVNGVEIADVEFEVVAIGDGFVRGLEGTYNLPGFPAAGESVDIRWSEPDQNFRMIRYNQ